MKGTRQKGQDGVWRGGVFSRMLVQQWRQRTCPGGASGSQISTGQLRGQRGDWLLTAGNGVWEAAGAILVCADVAERAGTKGDHEEGPVYVDTPGGQKTRGTLEKACGGRRRVIDIISGGPARPE